MKKNRMMRLASFLMVAVLLTTSMISGTFAKYVTTVDADATARVAKWGFTESSITFDNLFSKTYQNVSSSNDDELIAPGTSGRASFKFSYKAEDDMIAAPEVAYTFTVDTSASTISSDIENNENIKWALTTSSSEMAATNKEWGTWDELLAEINALDGDKAQYAPGELPTGFGADDASYYIHWIWVFETDDDANTVDTTMGNADSLGKVTLDIAITATQVD